MSEQNELNLDLNLKNVRISYPHLFEPKTFPGSTSAKFSATFLLDKVKHKDLVAQIGATIKALAAQAFKDKKTPMPDKLCLRDGDLTGRDENVGCWTLTSSESKRPVVVDQSKTPLVAADDVVYAGCYVNAKVRLWAQDNQYGRRINANVLGVQFAGDGERFGGAGRNYSADEMFDDVSGFAEETAGDDPFM